LALWFWIIIACYSIVPGYWFFWSFLIIIAFYSIDKDIGLLVLDHHRFLQHSSGILAFGFFESSSPVTA
jgi:hypothetical protein